MPRFRFLTYTPELLKTPEVLADVVIADTGIRGIVVTLGLYPSALIGIPQDDARYADLLRLLGPRKGEKETQTRVRANAFRFSSLANGGFTRIGPLAIKGLPIQTSGNHVWLRWDYDAQEDFRGSYLTLQGKALAYVKGKKQWTVGEIMKEVKKVAREAFLLAEIMGGV